MLNVADHGLACDVGQLAGLGEAEHVACWFKSSKPAMVSGTGKDRARTHPGRVTTVQSGIETGCRHGDEQSGTEIMAASHNIRRLIGRRGGAR